MGRSGRILDFPAVWFLFVCLDCFAVYLFVCLLFSWVCCCCCFVIIVICFGGGSGERGDGGGG